MWLLQQLENAEATSALVFTTEAETAATNFESNYNDTDTDPLPNLTTAVVNSSDFGVGANLLIQKRTGKSDLAILPYRRLNGLVKLFFANTMFLGHELKTEVVTAVYFPWFLTWILYMYSGLDIHVSNFESRIYSLYFSN